MKFWLVLLFVFTAVNSQSSPQPYYFSDSDYVIQRLGLVQQRKLQLMEISPQTDTGRNVLRKSPTFDIFNELIFKELDLKLSSSQAYQIYVNSNLLAASPWYLSGIYLYAHVYYQAYEITNGHIPLNFIELETLAFRTMLNHWSQIDWNHIGGIDSHDYTLSSATQPRKFAERIQLSLIKWTQSYIHDSNSELDTKIAARAQALGMNSQIFSDYQNRSDLTNQQKDAAKKLADWLQNIDY